MPVLPTAAFFIKTTKITPAENRAGSLARSTCQWTNLITNWFLPLNWALSLDIRQH